MFSVCCTCLGMEAKHQWGCLPDARVLAGVVFQHRVLNWSSSAGVGSDFIVTP